MNATYQAKQAEANAKKWAKKNRKNNKSNPVNEIKASLLSVSEGNTTLAGLPIWSQIMEAADSKGHFASDIIDKALNGQRISDKQAWVVGKFATDNNITK